MTQILQLWDVLFSCGIYVNILFIVACIIAMEDQIMRSESAAAIQALLNEGKGAPSFESREIITAAMSYVSMIPDELLSILRLHPTDEVVIPQVVVEVSQGSPAAAVSSPFQAVPIADDDLSEDFGDDVPTLTFASAPQDQGLADDDLDAEMAAFDASSSDESDWG